MSTVLLDGINLQSTLLNEVFAVLTAGLAVTGFRDHDN